jgi:hypothetical protein
MLRTILIRCATVTALTFVAACSPPPQSQTGDFVQAARDKGLAEGYGDEEVGRMYEDLCDRGQSGFRPAEVLKDYPKLEPADISDISSLLYDMCD